jgi:hypothetical protein
MSQPEFRVRPVIRHVVTRYSSEVMGNGPDGEPRYSASLETLGEFNNEGYAEIVVEALKARVAPLEYVIVQQRPGEIEARVMYAYSDAEVQTRLAEMEATPDGPRCQVFSRERNMHLPA